MRGPANEIVIPLTLIDFVSCLGRMVSWLVTTEAHKNAAIDRLGSIIRLVEFPPLDTTRSA